MQNSEWVRAVLFRGRLRGRGRGRGRGGGGGGGVRRRGEARRRGRREGWGGGGGRLRGPQRNRKESTTMKITEWVGALLLTVLAGASVAGADVVTDANT